MVSKIGDITTETLFDFAITIPIGAPINKHSNVATEIIANVAMVSSHIPNKPITINDKIVPKTKLNFCDAFQVKKAITAIITGQGELINNFSKKTKNCNRGSKKFSMPSPYDLENSLKELSTPFLRFVSVSRPKEGKFNRNSIFRAR